MVIFLSDRLCEERMAASYYLNFNETLTSTGANNDTTATINSFNDSSLEDVCQNFHVS